MGENIDRVLSKLIMQLTKLFNIPTWQLFWNSIAIICMCFCGCLTSPEDEDPRLSDFSLQDLNPNSITYGKFVGPAFYKEKEIVVGFYFGDQG